MHVTLVQEKANVSFSYHLFHPYLLADFIEIFLAVKLLSFFPQGGLIPLHNASSYGHLDIAALLIRFQTAVNATDRWGFTPLHEAAQKGRTQLCALLLAHGADPYLKNQVSLFLYYGFPSLPFLAPPLFLSLSLPATTCFLLSTSFFAFVTVPFISFLVCSAFQPCGSLAMCTLISQGGNIHRQ